VSLRPDRLARVATAVSAFVAVLAGTPGTAAAVPPPPNPGDSQLDAAADDANSKAGTVDALAAKLAGAQDQLNQLHQQLHQQLELTLEQANKAMVDLQSAQGAAAAAANAAETDAQRAVRDADTAVLEADKQGTLFAVGSFQQGSTIGNFSAYLASTSPEDLLDRVALLNAVGGSKLDVMSTVAHALQRSVEANTAARATKERADAAAGAADNAKRTADTATRGATQAQQTQYVQAKQLETQRDRALYDYDAARQNATGLQVQRVAFDQWVAQRRASQAASDKAAAETARSQVLAVGSLLSTVPTSAKAQAVIKRAVSQLGVPYAWGGGNSAGVTQGIRDGGTADSYGDFAKVGFDCSGLMMYAFAAAGVPLPHYAGYQYLVGKQVPLSELQPGDMVSTAPVAFTTSRSTSVVA
jgi:cell wall-associated NlpC family hydrolase